MIWLHSAGSSIVIPSTGRAGSSILGAAWPDPELGRSVTNLQGAEWPDHQLGRSGSITGSRMARHTQQVSFNSNIQRVEMSQISDTQQGRSVSNLQGAEWPDHHYEFVLAPIYWEQNGQTLRWVDFA